MRPVDTSAAPRSAPRVVSAHQVSVDSLEAGATTREMIRASARSRSGQAGPSSAGSPSVLAMACTAATCPCGTVRVIVTACPAGTRAVPFSAASKRCPECGHKVRETYRDVCGYGLIGQARDKALYRR